MKKSLEKGKQSICFTQQWRYKLSARTLIDYRTAKFAVLEYADKWNFPMFYKKRGQKHKKLNVGLFYSRIGLKSKTRVCPMWNNVFFCCPFWLCPICGFACAIILSDKVCKEMILMWLNSVFHTMHTQLASEYARLHVYVGLKTNLYDNINRVSQTTAKFAETIR